MPQTNSEASSSKRETYQGITESLMFFMVETRPDIAFLILIVSRFAKNLSCQHIKVVKTIFRDLKSSKKQGTTYGGQDKLFLERYSNSNWAGDKKSQKSTFDYIFMLNAGQVSWHSKKKFTVALSSTKAEYIALTLAGKEAT